MSEKLIYRKLPPDEWGRLKPLFEFLDAFLPDSIAAQCAVAEDGAHIAGFLMMQLVPHSEPLWIDEAYRGRVNFKRLQSIIEPKDVSKALCVPGLLVIAETDTVARMAELCGYRQVPGTVWIKDLRKKEEAA